MRCQIEGPFDRGISMIRRLLPVLLSAATFVAVSVAGTHVVQAVTATTWNSDITYDQQGTEDLGEVKLSGDNETITVTIESGTTVKATSIRENGSEDARSHNLVIKGGGKLEIDTPENAPGIIVGGSFTIKSGTVDTNSEIVVEGSVTIEDEGTLKITSDDQNDPGIQAGSFTIKSGTAETFSMIDVQGSVTVEGGKVTANKGISAGGDITISGGTVTTTTGPIITETGNITISGRKTTVEAANADGKAVFGGRTVTVEAGSLSAKGADASIYSNGKVTIKDGKVTATTFDSRGSAISGGSIEITGGQVIAKQAVNAMESSGSITITGGNVFASGSETGIGIQDGQTGAVIKLGWTDPSDFIYASSYVGGRSPIQAQKRFLALGTQAEPDQVGPDFAANSKEVVTGIIDTGDVATDKIDDKTLIPLHGYVLEVPDGVTPDNYIDSFELNGKKMYVFKEGSTGILKFTSGNMRKLSMLSFDGKKEIGDVNIKGSGLERTFVTPSKDMVLSVKKADLSVDDINSRKYTGEAIRPAVKVKDGTKVLTKGTDYTVNYSDNVKPGTAKAKITGKNTYVGSYTKKFTILAVYKVTLKMEGKGSVTVSPKSGISGKEVTLKAKAANGYEFKQWKVISGGVDLANKKKATTTFRIKKSDVTVKAIFEKKVGGLLLARMKPKGDNELELTWTKIKGAGGYDIFFSPCGDEKYYKLVSTIKGDSVTSHIFKDFKGKSLKKKTGYKTLVRAWVNKDGKKKYVSKSNSAHCYTSGGNKGYTNAKSVTVDKTKVTLKTGKKHTIKAKVNKVDKKKKLMSKEHGPTIRYISS
ncbi:MAG: carbohydrate-binding domain-containing protein, partial [Lachnospiraceae bacterium]|nr:carbohydrate-binding domain-containing protein [Lachnospiraceae bacterium]